MPGPNKTASPSSI